jgi:hypothetical protein
MHPSSEIGCENGNEIHPDFPVKIMKAAHGLLVFFSISIVPNERAVLMKTAQEKGKSSSREGDRSVCGGV